MHQIESECEKIISIGAIEPEKSLPLHTSFIKVHLITLDVKIVFIIFIKFVNMGYFAVSRNILCDFTKDRRFILTTNNGTLNTSRRL